MIDKEPIYVETYRINSYECDFANRLRIHSLFNLFQKVAENHAEKMGCGYYSCLERKIAWVACGYHLEITRLPTLNETIIISTWPAELKSASCIRDFCVKDTSGNILINTSSKWALIDSIKMRPVIITKQFPNFFTINNRSITSLFSKITPNNNYELSTKNTITIRTDDIDANMHVNNALYPTWCLDCAREKYFNKQNVEEIQINFRTPAKIDDRICISTYKSNNNDTDIHIITNSEASIEYATVKFRWCKNDKEA